MMIKLKEILVLDKCGCCGIEEGKWGGHTPVPKVLYHVTKKQNLKSILKYGIIPKIPKDLPGEEKAVYLFPTKEDADNALMNWFGQRFDDYKGDIILLTINSAGLHLEESNVEYELISYNIIPPKNVVKWDIV